MFMASPRSLAVNRASANLECLYFVREDLAESMSLKAMSSCVDVDCSSLFTLLVIVRI